MLLGEILGRTGETEKANAHLATAMRLALRELQDNNRVGAASVP